MIKKLPPDRIIYCPHGYSIDLYCSYENSEHGVLVEPEMFNGVSKADVFRQAKKAGWVIKSDNSAICPKCMKVLKAWQSKY